jgi:hypothetical protein
VTVKHRAGASIPTCVEVSTVNSIIQPPQTLWRALALDRDPADPKWVILHVAMPGDIMPAQLDAAGRYQDWGEACEWVHTRLGQPVELTPMFDPLIWTIRAQRNRD